MITVVPKIIPRILKPFETLHEDKRVQALDICLRYILGEIDFSTAIRFLDRMGVAKSYRLILLVLETGLITTQVKFALIAGSSIEQTAQEWGLGRASLDVLSDISYSAKRAAQRARNIYLRREYSVFNIKEYEDLQTDLYEQTKDWLGKFTNKKMNFLTKGHSQKNTDIVQELLIRAYRKLPLVIPQAEDKLHLLNSFKRILHDQGINYIKSMTALSRAQLQSKIDSNGRRVFSGVTMSFDSMQESGISFGTYNPFTLDIWDRLESTISINNFYEELSQWDGKIPHSKYLKKVCKKIGMPLAQGNDLISATKDRLRYVPVQL